jgi:dTDP-4-amino-4,6-dideoxygalactose transaminase
LNSNWPCFEEDEINAVGNVLKSGKVNYWTGKECKAFEKEFAAYSETKYAISLANGTLALELALLACGIGAGDEVITTCRTFLASASSIVKVGAIPVIADVDLNTQNISLDTIKPMISKKTKAIICVHLAGYPCDMDEIMNFTTQKQLYVIEDCAQAHGAIYKEKKVGSIGHIGCFSFCQDKIMTTGGEGGMVVTNEEILWRKMWAYKDHGKDFDTVFKKKHLAGFRWLHQSFGSNYRMTEMQAAIGRLQLSKLEKWNSVRTINSEILKAVLSRLSFITIPKYEIYCRHAYYKFYVFFNSDKAPKNITRDSLIEMFVQHGLFCMQGSCFNITYEDAFKQFPDEYKKELTNANLLGQSSIMFLVDHTISYSEIELNKIIKSLNF